LKVVVGSVVDGLCANSATSAACWDGSAAIVGAVVTGELTCANISTTTERYDCYRSETPLKNCLKSHDQLSFNISDGSYALSLPYSASEHGTTSTLTYRAGGYQVSTGLSVTLGASSLAVDSARYQWVSSNMTDRVTGGGFCQDLTTRTYVDSTFCAVRSHAVADFVLVFLFSFSQPSCFFLYIGFVIIQSAGVEMCSLFAGLFSGDAVETGSICTCFEGERCNVASCLLCC
jgi:hypothetical protein